MASNSQLQTYPILKNNTQMLIFDFVYFLFHYFIIDWWNKNRIIDLCTYIYFKFQSIPEDGIQILNGVLHSHLAGRKMRLRHIRNGKELPVILQGEP